MRWMHEKVFIIGIKHVRYPNNGLKISQNCENSGFLGWPVSFAYPCPLDIWKKTKNGTKMEQKWIIKGSKMDQKWT